MAIKRFMAAVGCLVASLAATPAAGKFTAIAGFDSQIFPSYIIATAPMRKADDSDAPSANRLGDPRGVLGVEVESPADNSPVVVTIQCADCLESSMFVGTLPKAGETYRIFPKIKYKYGRLARCVQAAPAAMSFRVKLGAAAEEEETVICTVRAVNDCPFAIYEGDNVHDVGYTFAAYVNEQHPFVDKLLREALDRGCVDGFNGYQGDEQDVIRQAYALWDLLVARDMRYSSITVSAVSSETVASQHVRMIEDSVNNSEANCVDGSVLWASLMQRIGIDSFLIMEPTHCYAGFFVDAEHKGAYAIETTMLGADFDVEELEVPEIIEQSVTEDLRDDRSFASFVAAINYSTSRLGKSMAKEDEDAVECQIIDVAQSRKMGILPIAFQNGEEFSWNEYDDDSEEYESEELVSDDDADDEVYADSEEDAYDSEEEDADAEEAYEDDSEDGEESEWDEDDSSEDEDEETAYEDEESDEE